MNAVNAQSIMQAVFSSKENPMNKAERKTTKILEKISHEKIKKGDLAHFKEKQNSMAITIDNVARKLNGEEFVKGGDKDLTNKIFKEISKQCHGNISEGDKERLAKEMTNYANDLREASVNRVEIPKIEQKTETKISEPKKEEKRTVKRGMSFRSEKSSKIVSNKIESKHVGQSNDAGPDHLHHDLEERFTKLVDLGAVPLDIDRNAFTQNKVNLQLCIETEEGDLVYRDMTPHADNFYEFSLNLIENTMVAMGMTDEEGGLNQKADDIRNDFQLFINGDKVKPDKDSKEYVVVKSTELPDKDKLNKLKNQTSDPIRAEFGAFVKDLKESGDPDKVKLSFVIVSLGQSWARNSGSTFSTIAKEHYGDKRFPGTAGAVQLHGQTHYEITFQPNGCITNKVTNGQTNKDYKEKGMDYVCLVETTATLNPKNLDELEITTNMKLIPESKEKGNQLMGLQQSIQEAGFPCRIQMRDANSQKRANVTNALINAIRTKDLSEDGVFRTVGDDVKYKTLVKDLFNESDAWDPGKEILEESDVANIDITVLASAIKLNLRENELVSADHVKAFFLDNDKKYSIEVLEKATPEQVREFVAQLPSEKQEVIRNLIQLLHEVAALSDINRMNFAAIATSVGPSLMPNSEPLKDQPLTRLFLPKLMEAFPPEKKNEMKEEKIELKEEKKAETKEEKIELKEEKKAETKDEKIELKEEKKTEVQEEKTEIQEEKK